MIRLRQPEVLMLGLWFGLMHDPLGILRISLLCSLLHESGHIAAWVVFTGTLPVLELSPGGIGLCLGNARLSPCKPERRICGCSKAPATGDGSFWEQTFWWAVLTCCRWVRWTANASGIISLADKLHFRRKSVKMNCNIQIAKE